MVGKHRINPEEPPARTAALLISQVTVRRSSGPFALPTPAALTEAFLREEHRTITKTATISLHNNTYQVNTGLVGQRVKLVFNPFNLTHIDVRWHSQGLCQTPPLGPAPTTPASHRWLCVSCKPVRAADNRLDELVHRAVEIAQ